MLILGTLRAAEGHTGLPCCPPTYAATSEYELSSIPATMRKLFPELGGPLTKRDAWAATFDHVLTDQLRDDCPMRLPEVPPPPEGELERQLSREIDEHARGVIKMLCELVGAVGGSAETPCGSEIRTYRDFAPWATHMWNIWHESN